MRILFANANVYRDGEIRKEDISLCDGIFRTGRVDGLYDRVFDGRRYTVFPGFADVHVHFREPGFSYKETIASGSRAAARGGFTAVCAMPNLDPMPDSLEHLRRELEIIDRDAAVRVIPYGTITRGEKGETLSDMDAMAPYVAGYSDDGRGVQKEEVMLRAMEQVKKLGQRIVAHCEDNALLRSGYIHDGEYAAAHGHRGICSESEWGPIARDMELAEKTGCAYHVCHVSAKESVAILRKAKSRGLDVTCETAPHYLLLNDSMLREEGRFKMNPPVRGEADRLALLEGIRDGAVDMIATDHAPHSAEEKARGLKDSVMGVVGLETAFPLLYTYLVLPGELTLERLVTLMCGNPRRRFGLPAAQMADGEKADLTIFDLDEEYVIDPAEFLSMGRSTPFEGWKVRGRCLMTVADGKIAWRDPRLAEAETV